jgi:putative ABC transport system permease protein
MDTLFRDLRLALRLARRNPGFTAVAAITLALAIGANTAVFSVVNAVLLRPLPYPDPDRLVVVWEVKDGRDWLVAPANFLDWQERTTTLDHLAMVQPVAINMAGTGEPERLRGARVSPSFFQVLQVEPALGRGFLPEESEPGADRVVVLTHGLWSRRFGADPRVVGSRVSLDSTPYEVVGVMPEGFRVGYIGDPDAFVPRGVPPEELTISQRATRKVAVLGRVSPDRTVAEAATELTRIEEQLVAEYPDANAGWGVHLLPVLEDAVGPHRKNLLLVLAAVGLLLLIACANLTNLILARSTGRRRELALRASLGADRRRLARQLLTETALLGLAGGGLGLLLAVGGMRLLTAIGPAHVMRLDQVGLDGTVLVFTLVVSLATGLAVGLVPVMRSGEVDLVRELGEGVVRTAGSRRHHRMRNLLVAAQTAMVVVLLVAGGLLLQSFRKLLAEDPGFVLDRRVSMRIDLPESKYPEPPDVVAFFDRVLERIAGVPAVEGAGSATTLPLEAGMTMELQVFFEGRPVPEPADVPSVGFDLASPGYFETMGIPLLRGRSFAASDRRDAPPVMMVNQTMAERYWPGEDPVGQRIATAGPEGPWAEVIGMVGDFKRTGLELAPRPEMFKPYSQMAFPLRSMRVVVATGGTSAEALAPVLRQAVWEVDRDQPVSALRPLEQVVAESVSRQRFTMLTLGFFAAIALLLGAVGIYGVLSYAVSERTREVGVRMALGAAPGDLRGWIMRQGLAPVLAGLGFGVVAALAFSRLIRSLLFGVGAADPITFAAISALRVAVALAAVWLPARRATRIDPVAALRP